LEPLGAGRAATAAPKVHDDDVGTARMRKLSESSNRSEGFLIRGDHDL
jgi:hypothetical protein